jgi:hypothetical protein
MARSWRWFMHPAPAIKTKWIKDSQHLGSFVGM